MSRVVQKPNEPTASSKTDVINSREFSELLSWYGTNCTADDAVKFFMEYLSSLSMPHSKDAVAAFVRYSPTVAFVCRIVSRGAKIPASSVRWLEHKMSEFETYSPPVGLGNDRPETPKAIQKISIQEHMKNQVSRCIGQLEGELDAFILSDFKNRSTSLAVMRTQGIKGPQATQIITWFKRTRDEYQLALSANDPDITEAYSNFTRPQLKKLVTFCDQIMTDGLALVKESMDSRSPRKRKQKSPEQLSKKIPYQAADAPLGLQSLPPTKMVGALAAWTYHTKTKTLTLHVADDRSGLTFKGMRVYNTNKALCVTKRLRKPKETLDAILAGGKTIMNNLMPKLTTKASKYKDRMNKETIIVRVH